MLYIYCPYNFYLRMPYISKNRACTAGKYSTMIVYLILYCWDICMLCLLFILCSLYKKEVPFFLSPRLIKIVILTTYTGCFIMYSVITNIYKTEKVFWQLEMFDMCTMGDIAHIDTIFEFLPHTCQHGYINILHCCNGLWQWWDVLVCPTIATWPRWPKCPDHCSS
jgi:hypothetical protein